MRLGTENRLHEDLFDLADVSYINESLRADPQHSFCPNRKHFGCEVWANLTESIFFLHVACSKATKQHAAQQFILTADKAFVCTAISFIQVDFGCLGMRQIG